MVRTKPIRAGAFKYLPEDVKDLLLANGAVPVNDVFWDLWHDQNSKIWLLYGGYGSGKSVFDADYLIDQCLNNTYFKCIYGRKILESVRESVFATLCDRIEERGLQEHFTYSRKPKSSMTIKCLDNNNIFLPFGADKVEKLKSIKDVTHILCEEFDQFTEDDFKMLYSRLRYEKARLLFIGAFNTAEVDPKHWLKKFFFDPEKAEIPKTKKVFCNYVDNVFINQKEYEDTLWISAGFEQGRFDQISAGGWGTGDMQNLWAWGFSRAKHRVDMASPGKEASLLEKAKWKVRVKSMQIDPRLPVDLIFDFNVDPMTCLVAQHNGTNWGRIITEYRLRNSDIFEMLDRIKIDFGQYYLVATGDATGRSRVGNSKGKASYVDSIKAHLHLSSKQIKFPMSNPSNESARLILNAVLKKHPDFLISSECNFLIDDLETIKTDEDGKIDKEKEERKQRGHLKDNLKYFIWNYFRGYVSLKV